SWGSLTSECRTTAAASLRRPRARTSGTASASGPRHVTPPRGTRRHRRCGAGRHENDRGCEGASCSAAGDRPRARPPWGLTPPAPTEERIACSGAPPHADIELAMALIAVGEGLGPPLVRCARLEVDVLRGA